MTNSDKKFKTHEVLPLKLGRHLIIVNLIF